MSLYHQHGFPDPILYGHITDTLNEQIHVLLYVLNNPEGPRFDVDRMPDGTPTMFGTHFRNLEAEEAAMRVGLAPGQVRHGMRLLSKAMLRFEEFIESLRHDLYFVEPLFYHNAVFFERAGFNYQKGRIQMGLIQEGFSSGGELISLLDNSTPFRRPEAANSVRLRSWALHDGILGEPFTDITMYKQIGAHAGVTTCKGCDW
jgi:acetoin utilization protein AcuC